VLFERSVAKRVPVARPRLVRRGHAQIDVHFTEFVKEPNKKKRLTVKTARRILFCDEK